MPAHGALLFALPVAVLAGLTFAMRLFALGQGDFQFDLIAFPITGSRYQGVSVAFDLADQFIDFMTMQ